MSEYFPSKHARALTPEEILDLDSRFTGADIESMRYVDPQTFEPCIGFKHPDSGEMVWYSLSAAQEAKKLKGD